MPAHDGGSKEKRSRWGFEAIAMVGLGDFPLVSNRNFVLASRFLQVMRTLNLSLVSIMK